MRNESERELLLKRWGALESERSSWVSHWRDLSENLLPRNGRFFETDRNRGNSRINRIADNTGTRAVRILGAGMLGGLTSPARPWFRLTTADYDLSQYQPVKVWLAQVTRQMQALMAGSNVYRGLHTTYEELGVFGTHATTVLEDFDAGLHLYSHTAGEYALGTDYKGRVDTMGRKFQKTVRQLVTEFGYDNCSQSVRDAYDNQRYEEWRTVIHMIEPRADRNTRSRLARDMPFKSVYLEEGGDENQLLRESGFDRFRALTPRWITTAQDVYGTSPGMEVLGDVRQLQHQQLRKSQGIDYQTRPPLQAPTSMKHREVDILPGGVTFVDTAVQNGGIRPSFQADIRLDYLLTDIQDVRQRINSGFNADLFLMLGNPADTRMTATEVAERHEEKLLMLGPVLERLHNELLDPLVQMAFDRLLTAGALPPPPDELAGSPIEVEFVSILAQAQRAIGLNGIDRFVGNLGVVAQMKPDVLDKFNVDEWADVYSDTLGIDPALILGDDKVAVVRQQRAEQQAAAAAQEQAAMMAETAAKLGSVDTSGKNAATDVMNGLTGYGSPAPYTF